MVEGDGNFASGYTDLIQQFNAFVTSPLEDVNIAGLKSSQSALSWIMQVFVTFSAWITNYLPILISVWIISTVVNNCVLLSSFAGLFDLVSAYWYCCCVKLVEGDGNLASGYTDLLQQFNAFVTSPLEGVNIAGLKSSQSALSWIMQVFVTFSAWITNYLPILISVWIIRTVVSNSMLLSSSVGLFDLVSVYWF